MQRSRRNFSSKLTAPKFETLEVRQLLSAAITKSPLMTVLQTGGAITAIPSKPTAVATPTSKNSKTPAIAPVADPANIVWTNRSSTNSTTGDANDTDHFGVTFGTLAPTARAVVDAVIVYYEEMIGSFNYSTFGASFSLNLSMSGSGFGAGASLNTSLSGKPKSGTVTMGKGNATPLTAGQGSDQGWFIDPTPFDNSEFMGNITNEFSGDAPSTSPAFNKGDFFTVVAAEMTHCVGQFGSALAGWANLTTNTNVSDAAATGKLWVFRGPDIKHLMTSDNGGTQDFGAAIHTAEPQSITFQGDTYQGTQDQGNALYEFSRRYLIDNIHALMFKDAYAYSTVDPAQFGTFYSVLNQTTGLVTVRGGDFTTGGTASNDVISITRTGNTIFVSTDIGQDIAGSGALPGAGNLPAFVTQYDISQVTSISINAGAGNDQITIGAGIGVPISVDGGTGTDSLTIQGSANADTFSVTSSGITGDVTVNSLLRIESITINGGDGNDNITYSANLTPAATINGGNGNDTLTVTNANSTNNPIFVGGADANIFNLNSGTYTQASDFGSGSTNMTVNVVGGTMSFTTTQHLTALNISDGAASNLLAGGTNILRVGGLSILGSGNLDLNDNDMIVDYTGGSPLGTIAGYISSARDGGAWDGTGLTSSSALNRSPQNTTLGAMESSDYTLGSTFDGESLVGTSVLIKYTYYGDANFNGQVDGADYGKIDFNFSQQTSLGNIGGWANGDFDYNGSINGSDYGFIDFAFSSQSEIL